MKEGDDLWTGRMLYREFCSSVPNFNEVREGKKGEYTTFNQEGKPVYKITENKFDRLNSDFLNFFEVMSSVFPSLTPFVEQIRGSRKEVNYWIQDIENNQVHQVRVNQREGTMNYLSTHEVEFDEQGKPKGFPHRSNEIEKTDFREMVRSEEFKNNFTSLRQNIKG